jgi:hypothetical protein
MVALDYYIKRLPPFIGKEIFSFLVPNVASIGFIQYYQTHYPQFATAFINNQPILNSEGHYLVRLFKNNGKGKGKGKHRYYLTRVNTTSYCDGCGRKGCSSLHCRGRLEYKYYHTSQYLGKDLEKALLAFI